LPAITVVTQKKEEEQRQSLSIEFITQKSEKMPYFGEKI
jgi:hypothetical protein